MSLFDRSAGVAFFFAIVSSMPAALADATAPDAMPTGPEPAIAGLRIGGHGEIVGEEPHRTKTRAVAIPSCRHSRRTVLFAASSMRSRLEKIFEDKSPRGPAVKAWRPAWRRAGRRKLLASLPHLLSVD